jgi:hypothetical protein
MFDSLFMSEFETLLLQTKFVHPTFTSVCLMSAVKEVLHPPNVIQFCNNYSIILLIIIFAFSKVRQYEWLVSGYFQSVNVNQILILQQVRQYE